MRGNYDVVVLGAGFYGCVLAIHLAAKGNRVLVCEVGKQAMERASAVNQARIHTGFHYPRSYPTALRSLHNWPRFSAEFSAAVVKNFDMLYAIAKRDTKVNARRFVGMYTAMSAPIREATKAQRALFDSSTIEESFSCVENAFDYTIIRSILNERMSKVGVDISYGSGVKRISRQRGHLAVLLEQGEVIEADRVFNVTYAQLNAVLKASDVELLPLRHEFVEIALIRPPAELEGLGVTVMDGPFFSSMPYPAAGLYSLTHVRYSPQVSWTDETVDRSPYDVGQGLPAQTRWRHMTNDARRYVPALGRAAWVRSIFDVKTIPIRHDTDDGRPILLHAHDALPGLWSVLGSKLDNIYDLLPLVE